jgi:hypothetical protein
MNEYDRQKAESEERERYEDFRLNYHGPGDPSEAYKSHLAVQEVESRPERPSFASQKRQREGRQFMRSLLGDLAANPGMETGSPIHDEDKADFLRDVMDEAVIIPKRMQPLVREIAERIIDRIAAGDRQGAQVLAREQGLILGTELGESPSFTGPEPTSEEEIASILSRIPRA